MSRKVIDTTGDVDEVEKLLLGEDLPVSLSSKKISRTSLSDFILFYLFIEKLREKERENVIKALQNANSEDLELKKTIAETVKNVAKKLDKVTDILIDVYMPLKFKMNSPNSGSTGGKVEVELDVE